MAAGLPVPARCGLTVNRHEFRSISRHEFDSLAHALMLVKTYPVKPVKIGKSNGDRTE